MFLADVYDVNIAPFVKLQIFAELLYQSGWHVKTTEYHRWDGKCTKLIILKGLWTLYFADEMGDIKLPFLWRNAPKIFELYLFLIFC